MEELFSTPFGDFDLLSSISPEEKTDGPVRAWDAADEYILTRLTREKIQEKILVLNDNRGALICPLLKITENPRRISGITGSLISRRIIESNCRKNGLPVPGIQDPDLFTSGAEKPSDFGMVLMKIPRSLPYFEYQLAGLTSMLPPGIPVIAGGMSREMPIRFFNCFSEYTEESEYSLIKKRARIYTGKTAVGNRTPDGEIIRQKRFVREYEIPEYDLKMINLPGTFSLGKADPGTRFLLANLHNLTTDRNPEKVADPGCGDGILGMAAARLWKDADIICSDESYQAVKSAKLSAEENGLSDRLNIIQSDILEDIEDSSVDMVLCNPPFHNRNRISVSMAFRFIAESARVLIPDGEMLLVANRHLGYINTLRNQFTKAEKAAENSKYIIYKCRR